MTINSVRRCSFDFDVMPELHWQYGYAMVPTVISIISGWLYWRFRRNGWL
jgi:magnesium transporter